MSRTDFLHPEFVQFVPERLEEGVLYISKRYRTASHLCCCGCGQDVVTPLNPAKWQLIEHPDGSVSLAPSVGNWSYLCRSHYIISRNRIDWAGAFSPELIEAVQHNDRMAVAALAAIGKKRFWQAARAAWATTRYAVAGWFNR
jgi:hypothetical protein